MDGGLREGTPSALSFSAAALSASRTTTSIWAARLRSAERKSYLAASSCTFWGLPFQGWKQGWQLMRQMCLAATRRPHQQQVMSARGSKGQSLPCHALAREVCQGGVG